jgi:hypothetical protein
MYYDVGAKLLVMLVLSVDASELSLCPDRD